MDIKAIKLIKILSQELLHAARGESPDQTINKLMAEADRFVESFKTSYVFRTICSSCDYSSASPRNVLVLEEDDYFKAFIGHSTISKRCINDPCKDIKDHFVFGVQFEDRTNHPNWVKMEDKNFVGGENGGS